MASPAQCPKEFTITVKAAAPNPTMYWSFAGDSDVDLVQGYTLTELTSFHNEQFVAGFIDRAQRLKPDPTANVRNWGKTTGATPQLAYSQDDILLSAWVKIDVRNSNNFQYLLNFSFFDAGLSNVGEFRALLRNDGKLSCGLSNDTGSASALFNFLSIVGGPVVEGSGIWYFLAIWYDGSTGIGHVYLDNVELGTIGPVAPFYYPNGLVWFINAKGAPPELGDFSIDELAVFLNVQADAVPTFLYNGGVGRQYPF